MTDGVPCPNIVIAYVNGKAIMRDPSDNESNLYFCPIKEEFITIGENLVEATMFPIELLPQEEYQHIIDVVSNIKEGG